MKINREGNRIIVTACAVDIGLLGICVTQLPGWMTWTVGGLILLQLLFIIRFFRDPQRDRITDPSLVYSPCDGEVVIVQEVEEKEVGLGHCLQISVFMSIWNVHCNWFPVGGKVVYMRHHPGKYLVAWHPKSSEKNEHTTVVVDTGKCRVLVRQIAGFVARRIVCYASEGAEIGQNERLGFIKFGSRCDILVPLDAAVLVQVGDRVVGSQTPIAKIG